MKQLLSISQTRFGYFFFFPKSFVSSGVLSRAPHTPHPYSHPVRRCLRFLYFFFSFLFFFFPLEETKFLLLLRWLYVCHWSRHEGCNRNNTWRGEYGIKIKTHLRRAMQMFPGTVFLERPLWLPPSLRCSNPLHSCQGKCIARRCEVPRWLPKSTVAPTRPFASCTFLAQPTLASVLCIFKTQSASSLLGRAPHLLLPSSSLAQMEQCGMGDCHSALVMTFITYVPQD